MQMPPLVGRELDLAVGLEQLKRVEAGTSATLLVRGEAGIGKSRLAATLAGRADRLGYTVIAGRADDLDHGIPYAVLRDLLGRLPPPVAAAHRGLVDALRDVIDSGGTTAGDDGDVGAVFAAAVRLVRALADRGPTVLVLEDLHVADRASLAAVGLLARLGDVGLLVVVTLRPGSERAADLERLVEQMAFDGRAALLDLEPLDRHDVQAIVAAVAGAPPDDALTAAVLAASGGNPFFVVESVRSFADGSAVVVADGRARLVADAPAAGLRTSTSLLRRLVGGAAADTELAKVLAVFGRFSLRHLTLVERLVDHPQHEVAASFDRLVRNGVLRRDEHGAGYAFTHPIVRETLYEDIGPAERRRIHGAIAAELAADRRAGIVLDVAELAVHVAASAEPGDTAAAEVLLEAGRAMASTAPLVSADHVRRAVEILPVGTPARAAALALQTRALHIGARPREAAAVGRQALDALDHGPLRSATAATVANDLYLDGRVGEAVQVVEQALEHGGEACPLAALQVNLLMQADRGDDAAAAFPRAREALDGPDLPAAAQLMAMAHLVQYANHVGEVDIACALLDRVAVLTEASSPTVALAAHELAAFADWRPGLLARADRHLAAARQLRPDDIALSIGGSFEAGHVRSLWLRGEWDAALASIATASFELEQRGTTAGAQLLLAGAAEIHIDRGDIDQATAIAARLESPIVTSRRRTTLVRARLQHAIGDADAAVALLEAELAPAADGARGSLWQLAEMWRELVDLRVEAGRSVEAREGVAALDHLASRTGWLECEVPAVRARAIVERDIDAAHAYADLSEREGLVVERAHAALVLGELDVDPAVHLAAAYKQFDAFGAAPWRRRAASGLRNRGITVPRRAAQPRSALTDTEVQLVRLVREGLSNRQIATAMHYSPKTIEVYLSRVYAKSGCASRLELIRAVDQGTIDIDV